MAIRQQASTHGAEDPTTARSATSFGNPTPDHPIRAQAGDLLRRRYRLEELLVRRAASQTWRAFDRLLARPVIIHLLPTDRSNEAVLAAARRRAAAASDHRFLRVLDATMTVSSDVPDNSGIGPYIVCEHFTGQSLADLLANGPLSTLEAAWLVREVADALAGMHGHGLHHQRLSPANVVITADGNIKIIGFLEAELDPADAPSQDAAADDVQALGGLLYSALVAHWPGGPACGLPAAPQDAQGHPLTPLQVNPSVSPSLDQVCVRILQPGYAPLRTAAAVAGALSRVLGTADASEDLERRVRPTAFSADTPLALAWSAEAPVAAAPALASTAYDSPGSEAQIPEVTVPMVMSTATRETPTQPTTPPPSRSVPSRPESVPSAQTPQSQPQPQQSRRKRGVPRWAQVLVSLVALGMVSAVVVGVLTQRPTSDSSPTTTTTAAATTPAVSEQWPIVDAQDFDPEGNGEERPQQVPFAWDGDPDTSWTTMDYWEFHIGNKTGVGLIFDLGEVRQLNRVELDLDGDGTSLEVRVPVAAATTQPPLSGVDQWVQVGEAQRTPSVTTVTLDESVESRFVLIYLTELPASGSVFTGGIAEARFWS